MSTSAATRAPATTFGLGRAHYVILILLIIYVLSYLDRQIVAILAEPIKQDLRLSDTQIGLMAGLAFSIFYALMGFPLARLADNPRSNRVGLISAALVFWSAMTAFCGLSQNFPQLLLARFGVGIGEAGSTPAAHALISETVEPHRRSTAMAVYGTGVPIGSLLAFVIGGSLADALGWRSAFLVMGVPGVVVALVFWLTVKDPRRLLAPQTLARSRIPFREAVKELTGSKVFVDLFLCATAIAFLGFGKSMWTASFFIRSYGLSPGQVGLWYGLGSGLAGVFGTFAGGMLASRFALRRRSYLLWAPAVGLAPGIPLMIFGFLSGNWVVSLVLVCLGAVFTNLYYGPMFGSLQGVIRPANRATAVAVISFGQNMIGLGLGPLFFGALSDLLQPMAGEESLRWVLVGTSVLWIIPAAILWRAGTRLSTELRH